VTSTASPGSTAYADVNTLLEEQRVEARKRSSPNAARSAFRVVTKGLLVVTKGLPLATKGYW